MLRFLNPLRQCRRDRSALRPQAEAPRYRPCLEGLEDRVVPAAPALNPGLFAPLVHQAHNSVIPISITGITNQAGQLVAQGLIGINPFTAPVTLSTTPGTAAGAAAAATPILNLHLGEIHLDLLGLKVDTSEICVDI